jgi:hypothetical protein
MSVEKPALTRQIGGARVLALVAFELLVAVLLWTRFVHLACWAAAACVSVGAVAVTALPREFEGGCGCLGGVRLGPAERAALAAATFVLCALLLLGPRNAVDDGRGDPRERGLRGAHDATATSSSGRPVARSNSCRSASEMRRFLRTVGESP